MSHSVGCHCKRSQVSLQPATCPARSLLAVAAPAAGGPALRTVELGLWSAQPPSCGRGRGRPAHGRRPVAAMGPRAWRGRPRRTYRHHLPDPASMGPALGGKYRYSRCPERVAAALRPVTMIRAVVRPPVSVILPPPVVRPPAVSMERRASMGIYYLWVWYMV